MDLIKPKSMTFADLDGVEKTFTISRIPYIPAREILTQYPISALPKLGDYIVNADMMRKMMTYVSVDLGGGNHTRLTTDELLNSHVPDMLVGARLEAAMYEYNTNFSSTIRNSISSKGSNPKFQALISKISTVLRELSSQTTKQP